MLASHLCLSLFLPKLPSSCPCLSLPFISLSEVLPASLTFSLLHCPVVCHPYSARSPTCSFTWPLLLLFFSSWFLAPLSRPAVHSSPGLQRVVLQQEAQSCGCSQTPGIVPKYWLLVQVIFPKDSGEFPFLLCCTSFLAQTWPSLSPLLFNQKSFTLYLVPYLSTHITFPYFLIFFSFCHPSSSFLYFPVALSTHPWGARDWGGRKANHKQQWQQFVEHLLCSRCCTRHTANIAVDKTDKTLILGEAYFVVEGDR